MYAIETVLFPPTDPSGVRRRRISCARGRAEDGQGVWMSLAGAIEAHFFRPYGARVLLRLRDPQGSRPGLSTAVPPGLGGIRSRR